VLTHYNRMHCFPDVQTTTVEAVNEIKRKEVYDGRLVAFGHGDGGGGPTYGMLEDHKTRSRDLRAYRSSTTARSASSCKTSSANAVNLPVLLRRALS
jgi:alpha-mannosidase